MIIKADFKDVLGTIAFGPMFMILKQGYENYKYDHTKFEVALAIETYPGRYQNIAQMDQRNIGPYVSVINA